MPAPSATSGPSYRALLSVPAIGRVLLGMQIARIAQAMVGVAVVLFTLSRYGSPVLAGAVAAAAAIPGILASPLAGALLDRHGRTRLVILDYLVAAGALVAVASLSLAGALPAGTLIAIAAVASVTAPLSSTGLRSLFPLLVPRDLWERANAADSVGYVLASLVGPPAAGLLVQLVGGELALLAIAATFVVAALVLIGIPDPRPAVASTGRLWLDAWQGLVYTWRHPTLRALGFSISALNFAWGVNAIVIPLLVLGRLHAGPAVVGAVFAVQGAGGVASAIVTGRFDSRGRERAMLAVPMVASGLLLLLLMPDLGLVPLLLVMAVEGLLGGPMDVALFTIRQRRTDPAWLGRALAVSMAFNSLGGPIGSAVAGSLAAASLEAAILASATAAVAAGVLARLLVPAVGPAARPGPEAHATVADHHEMG